MSSPTGSGHEPTDQGAEPATASTGLGQPALTLLESLASISSGLDTQSLLKRIVLTACNLVGSQYGALGVTGHDGSLSDFVTHGIDEATIERIGHAPIGRGLLQVGLTTEALRLDDLSKHPASLGFPANHPDMSTLLVVPVTVRGTTYGQLYLSEKLDGTPFTVDDEAQVVALARVASFVVENAHAYHISERRRRWLEMFSDLNDLLQPPIKLSSALSKVASAVRMASGATAASIMQVPDQGDIVIAAQSGDARILAKTSDDFHDAIREVVAEGFVTEFVLDDEFTTLIAPLRAHLAIPGALVIAHGRRDRPDFVEERDLLTSFADQVALSLDRTQALEDREEMAVVADRDRIARELHDVVIQRLFATGLHLQTARSAAETPELKSRIGEIVTDIDQTIRDIRGTIFSLQNRPQDSLRAEIRKIVRDFVPKLGFAPSVQLEGPVDAGLGPQIQPVLVAVLREALTNIGNHAQAGRARIHLRVTDDRVQLRVSDNGRGMPEKLRESGLRNARRRALLLGGSLDLWPNDPVGTIFVWSVPLKAPR